MISETKEALVGLDEHTLACSWKDYFVLFRSRKALTAIMKRKSQRVFDSKKTNKNAAVFEQRRPYEVATGPLLHCNKRPVAKQ